jgi:hypothetical protein
MTRPNRQEWLDFAHTVDVMASSALARSDLAEAPGQQFAKHGSGLRHFLGSRSRRRTIGGLMAAACLLILALPAINMLSGTGNRQEVQNANLQHGAETVRETVDAAMPAINLQITLAKTDYQVNETLSYTLQTNQNCHALIYTIDADDRVQLHDLTPTGANPTTPTLNADTPLQVTGPNGQGPVIVPAARGNYLIGALCGRDALAAVGTTMASLADAASQGGTKFLAYLSELTSGINPNLLGDTRVNYAVN